MPGSQPGDQGFESPTGYSPFPSRQVPAVRSNPSTTACLFAPLTYPSEGEMPKHNIVRGFLEAAGSSESSVAVGDARRADIARGGYRLPVRRVALSPSSKVTRHA